MAKGSFTLFAVLIISALSFSCAHAPAGFAPSATPMEMSSVSVLGLAKGEMSYFSLLGIIPFGKPDYDAAIRDAISKHDGTKLLNVRATFSTSWVVVGFIHKLVVEGDVVK